MTHRRIWLWGLRVKMCKMMASHFTTLWSRGRNWMSLCMTDPHWVWILASPPFTVLSQTFKIELLLSSSLWREEYRSTDDPQFTSMATTISRAVRKTRLQREALFVWWYRARHSWKCHISAWFVCASGSPNLPEGPSVWTDGCDASLWQVSHARPRSQPRPLSWPNGSPNSGQLQTCFELVYLFPIWAPVGHLFCSTWLDLVRCTVQPHVCKVSTLDPVSTLAGRHVYRQTPQTTTWIHIRLLTISTYNGSSVSCLTLSLQRVINFKFSLQPHQIYNITQYE